MFRGAGYPSLFLLPFVEPGVSTGARFYFTVCSGDGQLEDVSSEETFAVCDKKMFQPNKRVTSLRAPLTT